MPGLFGIPMPVITTVVGFIMKAFTAKQDAEREKDERMQQFQMKMMAAQNEHAVKWMKAQERILKADPHFAWTRRMLALGIVFGSMAAFFVAPLVFQNVPFVHEVTSKSGGFFGLFATSSKEYIATYGIQMAVVYDFLSFLGVIVGMYFGDNRQGR